MLAYTTRGEGDEPVVLLHGFLGSGRNLASLARRWSEREPNKRFILPDLLGHGTSPALPESPALDDLARALIALLDHLCVTEPVSIVGHSMGGRAALVARDLAPMRVSDVTLLDIAPGPIDKRAAGLDYVLTALLEAPAVVSERAPLRQFFVERGLTVALADWLLMNLVPRDGGLIWRIDREALARLDARTRGADLWPALARAKTITREIRGERSRFVSDSDAGRLEEMGVSVATLAGAGHFVHVDAQEPLLDLLASQ